MPRLVAIESSKRYQPSCLFCHIPIVSASDLTFVHYCPGQALMKPIKGPSMPQRGQPHPLVRDGKGVMQFALAQRSCLKAMHLEEEAG